MSEWFESSGRRADPKPHIRYSLQRPLDRVLAFIGHDIDDLVNSPIVKNKVIGYYKLHRQIQRSGEILELEQQWNLAL